MGGLSRRDFLKIAGLTGSAALTGCSEPTRRLIPFIIPPEDIIPGEATWYATTCRECPAGCGILAKNRDGRIIKVEGNPDHPVNQGKLCARGQASVQGLYNPSRLKGPLQKNSRGVFEPIAWDQAENLLVRTASQIRKGGGTNRIVLVSELITGTFKDLANRWLSQTGSGELILYELYSYEPLRKANQTVFGIDGIPSYRIDRADFLISFGAPFLETWISNVEYARQFADFHAVNGTQKNVFVYVGPRFSMTAANADEWIMVSPGTEHLVAIALLKIILDENLAPSFPNRDSVRSMIDAFPLDQISQRSGVKLEMLRATARIFAGAKRPLALSGGLTISDPNALASAIAANLLCTVHPGTRALLDFNGLSSYGEVAPAQRLKKLAEQMTAGEIDMLLVHGANPVFTLPKSWNFDKAITKVPLVVSLSTYYDETSGLAHLVLPTHHFLETWGDYSPRKGITGFLQPTMGPFFNTRNIGDILISTGKKIAGQNRFHWKDGYELLRESWARKGKPRRASFEGYWQEVLRKGGNWETAPGSARGVIPKMSTYSFPSLETSTNPGGFSFVAYPTIQFFDGRMANRPFVQELPDPITMTTWGGWIEIDHATAGRMGIDPGDLLRVQSPFGFIDAPALPFFTTPPDTVAVPIGQGHWAFGKFADGWPANPMNLFSSEIEASTGALQGPSFRVTLKKLDKKFRIAHTDGSYYQYNRGLAQAVSLDQYGEIIKSGIKPEVRVPEPKGFRRAIDFYSPHQHDQYRWAMAIDLDRCIGCGACVVACYAENNVFAVGRKEILHQRETAWLRVERYFDQAGKTRVRYIPVPCQHCDEAPCESVCPVFAPNHNIEGINNQVYNRCIGTRDCSQNCPYKVRRFNFFTYSYPDPLKWQFNPDVTVRQKGVMEKCSFCIQRVIQAKTIARSEGRLVRDGEFTTACAQTCPAGVITFGNLKDPNSRVAKLFQDLRAYQLLYELNTKPGVVYLKKVVRDHIV